MRAYLLYTASLATAIVSGDLVLAKAHAEGLGVLHGRRGEITGGGAPNLPPGPFSGFDREGLWAEPEKGTAEENLDLEGRKPVGPARLPGLPAQAQAAAPKSGVAEAKQLKQALAPKPAPEAMRKQMLDTLFVRLRNAGDLGDAQRIAASIARVWLQSDSDTANLLMQRALVCVQARQYPLALSLFDKLVGLEPGWPEAWNQRATTRFLTGDTDGAMADIDRSHQTGTAPFWCARGHGHDLAGGRSRQKRLGDFQKGARDLSA